MWCTVGVGKTQFCIGCCVQAVVMSNSSSPSDTSSALKKRGGVVYIDTELKFDSMRLIDVAISSYPEIYSAEYSVDAPHQIDKFLKSVKVWHPHAWYMLSMLLRVSVCKLWGVSMSIVERTNYFIITSHRFYFISFYFVLFYFILLNNFLLLWIFLHLLRKSSFLHLRGHISTGTVITFWWTLHSDYLLMNVFVLQILQPGSCKELLRCIEDMQSFLIEEGVTLVWYHFIALWVILV